MSFAPPQQQQTTQQGGDDPLLQALAKYVTTGPGARHTTQVELREMVASTVARPGGRAHLEALCQHDDPHPDRNVWENRARAVGSINLGKAGFSVSVKIPGLDIDFEGDGSGFFRPFKGPLNKYVYTIGEVPNGPC